jgi:hypothetical protein
MRQEKVKFQIKAFLRPELLGKIYKKEGFISLKLCEILVFKKYFKKR